MLEYEGATERDRYFFAIANAAGDIIHFNNAEGPISGDGIAAEFMLGYGPGELFGIPVNNIIHPSDRKIVLNAMSSTVAGSASPSCRIRMLKKDGTLIDAQMSTFYIKVDGRGRAVAVLRDISLENTILNKIEKPCTSHQNLESNDHQQSTNIPQKGIGSSDIIPVCMYCNKIRNQAGTWIHHETYLQALTNAKLSHGICPECIRVHYPYFSQINSPSDEGK